MLQLLLIRHAKSSWKDSGLDDFDRPLNKRGLHDAPRMGRLLGDLDIGVDLMISSPANRALATARLLAAGFDYPQERIAEVPQLYAASIDELLHCVQSLDPAARRVALVAHNPGLTDFYNFLCSEYIDNLPTCSVAVIGFDLDDWRAVDRDSGRLLRFEYPKKHTQ
jgi:phosphohistidine phosphatase